MKRLISVLKKWNDTYPEHAGMLQLSFYDDESGSIYRKYRENFETVFDFNSFKSLLSTNPEKYKKDNS